MFRIAFLALGLIASPALATSHYHAQPTAKPEQTKLVLRDIVWKCGDVACAGGKGNSRPAIACAVLAREVGTLRSFSAGGEPFAADALQKCNARAD